MNQRQQQLKLQFPGLAWQFDVPLAPLTYFKLGGPAEALVVLQSISDLQALVQFCAKTKIPYKVVGGLSNVIVADEGVAGVVIRLQLDKIERSHTNLNQVTAQAGVKMATLVAQTTSWGLTGLEYFLGVPGSLGGAVFNNAHYLTELISQHITQVQVVAPTGEVVWLTTPSCDFGYDQSRFQKSGESIVAVEFELKPGDPTHSQALIAQATRYRAATQPLGAPSSGCIFQNVPNTQALTARFPEFAQKAQVPGGFLIDQAGLKGTRIGALEVSHKHAAFIINHGGGTAKDLLALIVHIKATVKTQFGVDLVEEVFFLR